MSALRFVTGTVLADRSLMLEPFRDIKNSTVKEFDWESIGEDPAFYFSHVLGISEGWYMLELKVNSSRHSISSRLYVDYGKGATEEASFGVVLQSGLTSKRLVYIKSRPRRVRFDPMDKEGYFSISVLRFVPVSTAFAMDRMVKKITTLHPKYQQIPCNDAYKDLEGQAIECGRIFEDFITDLYKESFYEAANMPDYNVWIDKYESPLFSDKEKIQREIAELKQRPLISLVLPTFNTEEKYLREVIDSIVQQSYTNWQLCIADDASTQEHVQQIIKEYTAKDDRIEAVYRTENGHISAASNSGFMLAKGNYVAFVDHDDLLSLHALYAMVVAINENPEAKLLYSDEDKIDENGERSEPYFKPDWNPDLLQSYNYICHLTLYKQTLVQSLQGFRDSVNGSQDYDLILRASRLLKDNEIHHVPHVLYHWRMIQGSTALHPNEKSYTSTAGVKALEDYFSSGKIDGVKVSKGDIPNTYKVDYPLPNPQPMVSLLVPTRDGLSILKPCIESILEKTDYQNYEIIIIDNQSGDSETLAWFKKIELNERVRVIQYDNEFNYSAINNHGVKHARGELIGLINNDVEVINSEWLNNLASQAYREGIGCVGAKLLYPDNTVQHAGVVLGLGGVAGHVYKGFDANEHGNFSRLLLTQNMSAVTAACLLIKKQIFEEVGGLNEVELKVAFNDVDLCLKVLEAGYKNLWTPHALLYHHESKSRGYEDTPEKLRRFRKESAYMKLRWVNELRRDPVYNPNLSPNREDFAFRN